MKYDYHQSDIDATAGIRTEHIAFVGVHKHGGSVKVEEVIVEEADGNANSLTWNVQLDGRQIFSADQSVSAASTPETFIPDQNLHATGDNLQLLFEVTGPTGTESGSEVMHVTVTLDDGREVTA